ncbi:hypothetical protein [Tenacibaculum sp. Bg11-29]|uniref:hypothetical protein n=1 Tax=Tenacibaculum sp. Bg11-29 TaxID=2058306 RepID=UPI0012FEFF2D|nr:hypothetical protein [Tenacibaculum sp. Bg11-29]
MKKAVLLLAMFSVIILSSCTDSSLENLPNETQGKELQSTNPGDDGVIVTEDPEDDGEG